MTILVRDEEDVQAPSTAPSPITCKYGSRSQAQVNGCLSHVDSHDIERLNTDAAKFARGSSTSATSRRLAPTASTR